MSFSSMPNMSALSSFQSNTDVGFGSSIDEERWVAFIRRILEVELEEDTHIPVSIFVVPKALLLSNPDSYIPREVAVGPHHCFRPELYDMEKYKLAAAQRTQREIPNKKLQYLVDQYLKYELKIRAYYHKPLNFSGETLAWMMVVDASFLFEFLQVCAVGKCKLPTNVPQRMSHLVELAANKAANNAIFRDIIMLENQIPLFVLRELLEFQFSSLELADDWLLSILTGLSQDLSPFKMVEESPKVQLMDCPHLLDFAYHVIVPSLVKKQSQDHHITEIEEDHGESKEGQKDSLITGEPSYVRHLVDEVWKILSKLDKGPIHWIKSKIFSKPFKVVVKLPWNIISNIPVLRMLKRPLENIFSAFHKGEEKKEGEDSGSNIEKNPSIEEIAIPCVIDLFEAGVCFVPTTQGIQSISFDVKTATLYLPTICVDVNSEIVLRNMVAYEACRVSWPMILTRYTELMNGIIDTEKDASILRESGIIINCLKSDKEVADLWNGMSKSIRLTKVPFIDKAIADVNKYYNGSWKVKFGKLVKKYIFGSWQILTFVAAIMLLLLMFLQAFCQVYSCSRIIPIKGLEPVLNHDG